MVKKKIPKAVREQLWIQDVGTVFAHECLIHWCHNKMTAYDFHTAHNIPESKGGVSTPYNLLPLCARCNQSMGCNYTITEWNDKYKEGDARGSQHPKLRLWKAQEEQKQTQIISTMRHLITERDLDTLTPRIIRRVLTRKYGDVFGDKDKREWIRDQCDIILNEDVYNETFSPRGTKINAHVTTG